jgi:hypothetical protein
LYTALQKEGFATENRRPDNTAFGVGDATIEERDGSPDDNGSALGDNSGGSPGEHAHYTVVEIDDQFSNVA